MICEDRLLTGVCLFRKSEPAYEDGVPVRRFGEPVSLPCLVARKSFPDREDQGVYKRELYLVKLPRYAAADTGDRILWKDVTLTVRSSNIRNANRFMTVAECVGGVTGES